MISRLLIANRGEIVVRVARTAHRMGIDTVGVYSEPDRDSPHVDAVDLAVALGGRTPAESYLHADAVIAAALSHDCDGLHPGYGFLAENAEFARRVTEAGITWVGPTPEQIALLGDKVAAKKAAVAAGVPTTPVYDAHALPSDLPFPVLVKAAAGGGGRGMRIVHDPAALAEAVESAAREALAAFGDGAVFVEPYLSSARHIEVQIIGDHVGTIIHLGERDCSVQRRNQKIIEESPAPNLAPEIRRRLHAGAVSLARAVGYVNAGTVEFLVGADDTITFLEVNTRLQVEHPVTEAVTGLDLVELQLRVAAGEPLPVTQADVQIQGHAIEARVVAERPAAGWLPATGTLAEWAISPDVRVDSGVRVGSQVSADYDSLLAKVIAHRPDRVQAARLLRRSLRGARVAGVSTNLATLAAILDEPDFLANGATTDYLDRHSTVLTAEDVADFATSKALLIAAVLCRIYGTGNAWAFAPAGWRNVPTQGQRELWQGAGADAPTGVEWRGTGPDQFEVLVGSFPEPGPDGVLAADRRSPVSALVLARTGETAALEIDGVRRVVHVSEEAGVVSTATATGRARWAMVSALAADVDATSAAALAAPLPGTVTDVRVGAGDAVTRGQVLVVMEAMKMEHSTVAPRDGVISEVSVAAGDRVCDGDVLVHLIDEPAPSLPTNGSQSVASPGGTAGTESG